MVQLIIQLEILTMDWKTGQTTERSYCMAGKKTLRNAASSVSTVDATSWPSDK